ncbi:cobalamin-binding protein [uncultured Desulfosarcina sp.]|uniref:ABC transporter substrate-binding protein n=1 Tax=uncultured Desulfosarcina sp. TaxID=218289 RepID=UPI0029C7AFE5|nr:cobalamin-binding protein [uncultured Desulfosarcina sp.]
MRNRSTKIGSIPRPSTPATQRAIAGKDNVIQRLIILFFALLAILAPINLSAATVVDQLGRNVQVPDRPVRIVCLAPSITEILFALDLSDRLVGATQFSDYPPRANALPKVGSYIRLDVEKIVALQPDLCIAVKDGNPITAIHKLEALDIPVYAVDPRDLEAVMDTLQELGGLLGVSDRSDAIVAGMRQRIERVRRAVAGTTHRPKVFFQIGIAPIVSVGTNTFIHELIVMAGGVNLAAGDTPYPRFSKEAVIASRPEVLIITSMARKAVFEQVKREWREWEAMPAVKNDRIYLVDSNVLDRATPRLVDGLEMLARLIHPDRCGPNRLATDDQKDKEALP